ncbi:MAG: response regulator transcription factor [Bacteroidetes bacterium]|nr:response regulator transcription factor [Bacteroidota bacterium]MBS1935581.1 response regulator transcription factor [Bacteroidota bacterium]
MIKVCFVEDSPVSHRALKVLMQESKKIDLVGMYSNAESFLAEYPFIRPDIVVVDLQLPGISGLDAICTIKAEFPDSRFLVLTAHEEEEMIFKALRAGAGGYILKKNSFNNIAEEIISFYEGGAPLTPLVASKIIHYFQQDKGYNLGNKLTEKEKDILKMIVDGLLYKEIASQKSISIDGIKKHVSNIYEKLQVRTRSEAIKKYFTQMKY